MIWIPLHPSDPSNQSFLGSCINVQPNLSQLRMGNRTIVETHVRAPVADTVPTRLRSLLAEDELEIWDAELEAEASKYLTWGWGKAVVNVRRKDHVSAYLERDGA